ncbi:MAG: periplasmic sensor signal transduction histidine kinase [Bradyrhizobium sp.]|jgi:two-component system OmpR family sensor kinase|nr:periplasmic sensor signal transduction histidine kinase [Bradyrhizobium sp.]
MSRSLQGRLVISLTAMIVIAGVIAGIVAFRLAFDEAIELQDSILLQVGTIAGNIRVPEPIPASGKLEPEAQVVIEELNNAPDKDVLRSLPDGLHIVSRSQAAWRLLIRTRADGSRVLIGQPIHIRNKIATNSALHAVVPLVALLPCLVLVVTIVIRRTLRPMAQLAGRLDARPADDLETLPLDGTPGELHPFIASINHLLERVQTLIDQQRRFIADAAHELRTPITAISLQAENLGQVELPPDGRSRLSALVSGARRTAHLLDQLLALARYDVGRAPEAPVTSLDACTMQVVADLLPRATERGIDLGFEIVEPLLVRGEPAMLMSVVHNLIDNALRHTPVGGRIDIGVYRDGEHVVLQIEDTGPGIAPADYKRVFEPFVRGSQAAEGGTGLGLSIVKRIVERLKGSVVLENLPTSGLRATVSLPVQTL